MKRAILLGMAVVLAGCGGAPRQAKVTTVSRSTPISVGPISKACLVSGREARSGRLCGCIQAVADQTLSPAQQRRAVGFYANPHLAQEVRQSDRAVDEAFWKAYVAYSERAQSLCR